MRLLPLLILLAGAAAAEGNPIVGTYADQGGCARLAGQVATTDMIFILTPETVERYESSCDISSIVPADAGGWQLDVTCSGEGDSWTDSYHMTPLKDEDGYLVMLPDNVPEISFELRRCE